MKLAKMAPDPTGLLQFFEQGLQMLGAVTERTWHDRLAVIAEGAATRIWNTDEPIIEREIQFLPADDTNPRQADTQVFSGCPLTFRLAEILQAHPPPLQQIRLQDGETRAPDSATLERRYHEQFSGHGRWKMESPPVRAWHHSLVAVVRCEIQAIDQYWSLHRLAISLPDGSVDESLALNLEMLSSDSTLAQPVWPEPDPAKWEEFIGAALRHEIEGELSSIRNRQQNYLKRELARIDDYFSHYRGELEQRKQRAQKAESRARHEDRLAATDVEHQRRREDQVKRHEILVRPAIVALLMVAEPAFSIRLTWIRGGRPEPAGENALFVPRTRRGGRLV